MQHPFTRAYVVKAAAPALAVLLCSADPDAQRLSVDLGTLLRQAGDRVEQFFTRAQRLVCTETVWIQLLNPSLTVDGSGRTVESELRLSWDPGEGGSAATEAQVQRQVLHVNGRAPRKRDFRNCTAPEQNESETQPLSMLLPKQRGEFVFTLAGSARVDGREAITVDFREIAEASARAYAIENNEDCIGYDLTGGARGRIWIDSETYDVVRLDRRLGGLVDVRLPRALLRRASSPTYWTLERWDVSMRFGRVTFSDPEESLVLPVSSSSLNITRGAGRVRMETKYTNYKRFLTGGRVVQDDDDRR